MSTLDVLHKILGVDSEYTKMLKRIFIGLGGRKEYTQEIVSLLQKPIVSRLKLGGSSLGLLQSGYSYLSSARDLKRAKNIYYKTLAKKVGIPIGGIVGGAVLHRITNNVLHPKSNS